MSTGKRLGRRVQRREVFQDRVYMWCTVVMSVFVFGSAIGNRIVSLPGETGGARTKDIVLLVICIVALVYGVLRLARVRVIADPQGVVIVNAMWTHRLGWDEIERFTLVPRPGWLALYLAAERSDGSIIRTWISGSSQRRGKADDRARSFMTRLNELRARHLDVPTNAGK